MGFTKANTSEEAMGINLGSGRNSDIENFDDITLLRNRPRDAFYYFHDKWRLHPRLCGAFIAIILISLPISIAFGVLFEQKPDLIYKWVTYPIWIEANAAYSYNGVVATDDARCSKLGTEILEVLGSLIFTNSVCV